MLRQTTFLLMMTFLMACASNPAVTQVAVNSIVFRSINNSSDPDKRIHQYEQVAIYLDQAVDKGLGKNIAQDLILKWVNESEDINDIDRHDLRNIVTLTFSKVENGITLNDKDKTVISSVAEGIRTGIDDYQAMRAAQ